MDVSFIKLCEKLRLLIVWTGYNIQLIKGEIYLSQQNINYTKKEYKEKKFSNVLYVSAFLVALFVMWGMISPSSLNNAASNALGWMIDKFGWFYMLIAAFFVLFIIVLAISPLGKI